MKDERFNLMLSAADKAALKRLAEAERLPAAAVVRRLVWEAAQQHAIQAGQPAQSQYIEVSL